MKGWGHKGISLREKSGLQRSGQGHVASSSGPERVQPVRQNAWNEKAAMMELPGSPKGQMRPLQRRRELARSRGGTTRFMGRETFIRKER